MKKLIFLFIACCMVFVACGETGTNETGKQNQSEDVKEKDSESNLKIGVADFCSFADMFVSTLEIAIADDKNDFSECEEYYKKMEDTYKRKIEVAEIDSVHKNDIKEGAADIVLTSFTILETIKDGSLDATEYYEFYQENEEHIKEKCDEIKSYLE